MIDIDDLSRAELIELNHRIIERLEYLDRIETHLAMLRYQRGDRVSFRSRDGREVTGVLTKHNHKTVTVVADDGRKWNVSPGLLSKEAIEGETVRSHVVVPIEKG